jgi:hypothetical protein
MEILIIYNSQISDYAAKVAEFLKENGFSVNLEDISIYSGNTNITTVPTFLIRKAEKEGYMLNGKQPLDVILNWAKNSGARNN